MKNSDEEITEYMRKYKRCPDCSGDNFLGGPEAGMCVNIACASCGARFNVTPTVGEGLRAYLTVR